MLSLAYATLSHSLFMLALIIVLLLISELFYKYNEWIKVCAAYVFVISFIICNIDLVLLRFTGNKFTPEVLKFYGLKYVFHPDVVEPLLKNPLSASVMLGAISSLIIFVFYFNRRIRSLKVKYKYHLPFLTIAFVLTAGSLYYMESKSQLKLSETRPPEIVFIKSVFGIEQYVPTKEQELQAKNYIREYLGIDDEDIIDDNYPLLHKLNNSHHAAGANRSDLPDIFVIAIESLRGYELKFTNSTHDPAYTPTIDSLAKNSIVFPRFISNGWPSEEGFVSTMTSGFPHRLKHISVSFDHVNFDSMPLRLQDAGYSTQSIWGTLPADRLSSWCNKWFQSNDYPDPDVWHDSDAVFFRRVVEKINQYDSKANRRPLFMYIQNGDTHMPFETTSGRFETNAQKELAEQYSIPGDKYSRNKYKKALEWTDLQLGHLLNYLHDRERHSNSIIILIGDHSILVDESFGHGVRPAPSNAYVHTGALISGPQKILGTLPQVKDFPASQVDIMPTVLSLINYDRSISAWGTDLLNDNIPKSKRNSIAVRPGVFRLDLMETTLFVNANNPSNYWGHDFFDFSYSKNQNTEEGKYVTELDKLYAMMYYWSFLLETNHVRPNIDVVQIK